MEYGYKAINYSMGISTTRGRTKKTADRIIKELSNQGYNALIDEHDVRHNQVQALMPTIIFNAQKSLKETSNVKQMTIEEINEAINKMV